MLEWGAIGQHFFRRAWKGLSDADHRGGQSKRWDWQDDGRDESRGALHQPEMRGVAGGCGPSGLLVGLVTRSTRTFTPGDRHWPAGATSPPRNPRLQTNYPIILIDGGGRITVTARATVAVADFLLVPTLASTPDARSTQHFFQDVVEEGADLRGHSPQHAQDRHHLYNTSGQTMMKVLGYPVLETGTASSDHVPGSHRSRHERGGI